MSTERTCSFFQIFCLMGSVFGFGSSERLIPMFNCCISSNKKTSKRLIWCSILMPIQTNRCEVCSRSNKSLIPMFDSCVGSNKKIKMWAQVRVTKTWPWTPVLTLTTGYFHNTGSYRLYQVMAQTRFNHGTSISKSAGSPERPSLVWQPKIRQF